MPNTVFSLADLNLELAQVTKVALANKAEQAAISALAPTLQFEIDRLTALIAAASVPAPVDPSIAFSASLGPTFDQLNPGAVDTRKDIFKPASTPNLVDAVNGYGRVNPWEVGNAPAPDSDYWSCVGQVAYIPDDPSNVGIDRFQSFAYYNHVFATSPRINNSPEPFANSCFDGAGKKLVLQNPIAVARNGACLSNEALVVYANNWLAPAGTQTSRAGTDWPLPVLQLPATKKVSALALTTQNEFLLIACTDIPSGKGQVGIVALEGKYLPFHTWSYIGLPNQGSWSDFKLMGFIDLPFVPDAISAATNGFWLGTSATNGQTLGQINLLATGTRDGIRDGNDLGWSGTIAKGGFAVVSGKSAGKVAFIDLAPLMGWVRTAWLGAVEQPLTIAARAAGSFPGVLTPVNTPTIKLVKDYIKPTCVLAGAHTERWGKETHKAYIATESGLIDVVDTSSLMNRWEFEPIGALATMCSVQAGKNPVSMCLTRFTQWGTPGIPNGGIGDPLNSTIHVACRGSRSIDSIVSIGASAVVYQSITDKRLIDPVGVSSADRDNTITVCDFAGKKLLNYRIGPRFDRIAPWPAPTPAQLAALPRWDCGGPGKMDAYECGGELLLPGHPFHAATSNLN